MKQQSLVIWFKNGNAAKFEQVENFVNETASNGKAYMSFSYFGVSTQVKRQAVFVADNIAGFALEE